MNRGTQPRRFDVFLSHNGTDKPIVRKLGKALRQRSLRVWLDEWELAPGDPWQAALQEIIESTKSAAVLVGSDGIGPWQSPEIDACVSEFVDRRLNVIPVLLPGHGAEPTLPPFLKSFTWVDMREGITPENLDRLVWGITGEKRKENNAVSTDVSISRLPRSDTSLVGRTEELNRLDEAWKDPEINIVSIVAMGGIGKTALVYQWLTRLREDDWREARVVFADSFYNEGDGDVAQASSDNFLVRALEFFDDPDPNAGSSWDKGERLARCVRRQSTLLVLDGIEPLQHSRSSGRGGEIRDVGLLALLRELADDNNGLCVITTRENIKGLGSDESHICNIALDALTPEEGAALLQQVGVKGTTEQLQNASSEVKGHGLSLVLLGKYLVKAYGGDVKKRSKVSFANVDKRQGGHASAIMTEYESWFGVGEELCIMRLLGLFDRPATAGELQSLRDVSIPELTDAIQGLSDDDWNWAVSNLRECGLVSPGNNKLDAHPIVREHFANQLKERHADAARLGHQCLYKYLKKSAQLLPKTMPDMMPLYHAVRHGCHAGLETSVVEDVFIPRIIHGNENRPFAVFDLGAVGADLTAISNFFERMWDGPKPGLAAPLHGPVCLMAGLDLRASARLEEAEQATRHGLEVTLARQDWKYAGIAAVSLGDLLVLQGKLGSAAAEFERAIDLADRVGSKFWQSRTRSCLGHVLHMAGFNAEARLAFEDAELLRGEQYPESPLLYGLHSFRFCELILDEIEMRPYVSEIERSQRCLELQSVRDRVTATLGYHEDCNVSVLDRAMSELTIVKSWLLELEFTSDERSDCLEEATKHLLGETGGLSLLRQTGRRDYLPCGFLSFAELSRRVYGHSGDLLDLDEAQRVLTRAESIASDGPLLIWQVEAALERVRYELVSGDNEAAAESLRAAQSLVEQSADEYSSGGWNWDSQPPAYVGVMENANVVKYKRRYAALAALRDTLNRGAAGRVSEQERANR